MTDSLPYWKFFADEWISGNIQAHDMETQGVFINLCARAWKDGGYVEHNNDKLARLLRVDKQVLASAIQLLLDDDLLVEMDGHGLSSKFILLQLDERNTLSDKRSKAGRKGGKAKQLNKASKSKAIAKQRASIKEVEAEVKLDIELPPTPKKPMTDTQKAERIYKEYPKQVGRGKAIASIVKALKNGADPNIVINAVIAYGRATNSWPAEDRQYIPNPATWFNQERWTDDQSEWTKGTKQAANGSDYVVATQGEKK